MENALFSWSSGKDSAQALYEVMREGRYNVVALVTSVTRDGERVALHGVSTELVRAQAASIGLPLEIIRLPGAEEIEVYEKALVKLHLSYRAQGVNTVIFGDINLRAVRARREANLGRVGMQAHFPLWESDTNALANLFIARGFKAYLCAASAEHFAPHDVGAFMDERFFAQLPTSVDPLGENGEYHSFVYDGPLFKYPLSVRPENALRGADNMLYRNLGFHT